MKIILVYRINDYPENGGGLYYSLFDDDEQILRFVNDSAKKYKDQFEIEFCGLILNELKIIPLQVVTEYSIDKI